jgi:hypothetical protein
MRDVLHPDCELVVPDSIPYGGAFRGVDAVIGWFTRELWRWFDEFASTPEGFIDGGDQIVVPVHVQARAKNGTTMDVQQRLDLRVQRRQVDSRAGVRGHRGPARHRRGHYALLSDERVSPPTGRSGGPAQASLGFRPGQDASVVATPRLLSPRTLCRSDKPVS